MYLQCECVQEHGHLPLGLTIPNQGSVHSVSPLWQALKLKKTKTKPTKQNQKHRTKAKQKNPKTQTNKKKTKPPNQTKKRAKNLLKLKNG